MKEALMNLKCKMCVTPEESEAVQEAVFAAGGIWDGPLGRNVGHLEKNNIYIGTHHYGCITHSDTAEHYNNHTLPAMTAQEVIALLTDEPAKHEYAECSVLSDMGEQLEQCKAKAAKLKRMHHVAVYEKNLVEAAYRAMKRKQKELDKS